MEKEAKESLLSKFNNCCKVIVNNPTIMGVIIGFFMFLVFSILYHYAALHKFELNTLSLRFKYSNNNAKPSKDIVILGIDSQEMIRFGRWPWNRQVYADILDALNFYGAKSVSFDIFYPSNSNDKEADRNFADAIKRFQDNNKTVILGSVIVQIDKKQEDKYKLTREDLLKFEKLSVKTNGNLHALQPEDTSYELDKEHKEKLFYFLQKSYPEVFNVINGIGLVNVTANDLEITKIPLFIEYEKMYFPTLGISTYLKTLENYTVTQHLKYLSINNIKIPIIGNDNFLINWYKPSKEYPYPYKIRSIEELVDSYAFVREGSKQMGLSEKEFQQKIDKFISCDMKHNCPKDLIDFVSKLPDDAKVTRSSLYKNAYVFIGVTDQFGSTKDTIRTPLMSNMPGVFLHATVFDNLRRFHFIKMVSPNTTLLLMLVLSICTGLTVLGIKDPKLSLGIGSFYLFYFTIPIMLFKYQSIYSDLLYTEFSIICTYVLCVVYQWRTSYKDRKLIEGTFSNYLSPQILTEVLSSSSGVELGGDNVNISILFSDIRGFTSISEQSTPKEVVAFLNEYFDAMVDAVFKNEGTIDKFIGDAIMAFWGAPVRRSNHAELAIKGALDMVNALEKLKEKWKEEGKNYPEINIGIGINTGEAIVGNVGSSKIMGYTIIGDSVNLASRLEGLNKKYAISNSNKKSIIISEYTYENVKDIFDVEELGQETVKGKAQAVTIYRVNGIKGE